MRTIRNPVNIQGTLAERATLQLQSLPYGTRFTATDGPEAVVAETAPNSGIKFWAPIVSGSSAGVTFGAVKAALAAADSPVSFNNQALDGISDLTMDNNLVVENGNLTVSNGNGFIGSNLTITNQIAAAGGFPLQAPIWGYVDISASETDIGMWLWGEFEFDELPWFADRLNGSLKSLVIWTRQAVTAGTLSVNVFKANALFAGTTVTIPVGQRSARIAWNKGDKPYLAADGLDLRYTTSLDYAPTPNNELMAALEVYAATF